MQQLLPELLQLVLQQLLPELLLRHLLHPELLPASELLPTSFVLPADDLLRAGHDLQLPSGDDLPACHRVRADVQHLLRADDDLQLRSDLQLRQPTSPPATTRAATTPLVLQQLLVLAFVLQLVQQLLAFVPLVLQLQLRWTLQEVS